MKKTVEKYGNISLKTTIDSLIAAFFIPPRSDVDD